MKFIRKISSSLHHHPFWLFGIGAGFSLFFLSGCGGGESSSSEPIVSTVPQTSSVVPSQESIEPPTSESSTEEKEDLIRKIVVGEVKDFTLDYYPDKGGLLVSDYKGHEVSLEIPSEGTWNGTNYPIVGIAGYGLAERSEIRLLSLGKNIEYIGERAFANSSIEFLYATSSLVHIDENAFADSLLYDSICSGEYQYVPSLNNPYCVFYRYIDNGASQGISDFVECIADNAVSPSATKMLQSSFPINAKAIGDGAWDWDYTYRTPAKEASFSYLGKNALRGCTLFKSVTITGLTPYISKYAFAESQVEEVIIPSSVLTIQERAFFNCAQLKSVSCKGDMKITSIEDSAFYGCSSLVQFNFPGTLLTIGKESFANSGVSTVSFGGGLKEIGESAFYKCENLTHIQLPEQLESVGDYAFAEAGLTWVAFNHPPRHLGTGIFGYDATTRSGSNTLLKDIYVYGEIADFLAMEGKNCFVGNVHLMSPITLAEITEVAIPDGMKEIPDYAFYRCSSLTAINMRQATSIGVSAFESCLGLERLVLPSSLLSVGSYSFYGCIGLTDITFPSGLTSIGESAFEGCEGLKNLALPSGLTEIKDRAFFRCVELAQIEFPSSLTSMGENAFAYCVGLKDVSLNGQALAIAKNAFYGCTGLKSITLPTSMGSLGESAFGECPALTDIFYKGDLASWLTFKIGKAYLVGHVHLLDSDTGLEITEAIIPSTVTSISNQAFRNCDSITSISFPSSVTSFGGYPFSGCSSLMSVSYHGTLEEWLYLGGKSDIHFSGDFHLYLDGDDTETTSIVIPESWASIYKNIGSYAFYNCVNLESVSLSETITAIRDHAFMGCSKLTTINIPTKLTNLGSLAFYDCSSLTKITLPTSISIFPTQCFTNCSSLESVSFVGNLDQWLAMKDKGAIEHEVHLFFEEDGTETTSVEIKTALVDTVADPSSGYTFWNCVGLERITISVEATPIPMHAFEGCRSLKTIINSDRITVVRERGFYGCSSLTSIVIQCNVGNYAFKDCSALTNITIGVSSEKMTIGESVLSGCSSLESISVPFVGKSVTEPKTMAYFFGGINNGSIIPSTLKHVEVSDLATSIYSQAFYGLSQLESIKLGDGLTHIGKEAFQNCSSATFTIPTLTKLTQMGDYAFGNCAKLESFAIPSTLKTVPDGAFAGCSSLSSLIFQSDATVTTIGTGAFLQCVSLKTLSLPSSVTEIELNAFNGCSSLVSVYIPSSVTKIGYQAFANCPSTATLYCQASSAPAGWTSGFNGNCAVVWGYKK